MEPYYTQAEQLYQVHGARGEDPTEPPASAPYPFPAVSHEPRIQQLSDDLAAAGLHPFHAPCGILLDEGNMPYSKCVRCDDLRRLPVPGARQVRRRGDRRPPGARAPERHAADATPRRCGWRPTPPGRRSPSVVVERDGASETYRGPTSWSCRAARPTAPSCCSPRPTTRTRAASPTAPTRSGATTCSTTARPCSRCPKKRTRRCSRRRSGSTTSTSRATDFDFPLGNIQMVGKSQAPMFRGEKPVRPSWRPSTSSLKEVAEHAVDFWLSTEDLPQPDNRVTLDGDGKRHARATRRPTTSAKDRLFEQLKVDARPSGHARAPPAPALTPT